MSDAKQIGDVAREIARGIWLGSIDTCPDITARTQRIGQALQKGIITREEAAAKYETVCRMIIERMAA